MKVIFLGTPVFAVAALEAIYNSRHTVAAVVTQPDRINGRSKKISFSPVKEYALTKGIPVYQFEKISAEGKDTLASYGADIMVTAAYGQILRQNILDMCPKGVINVHASSLPRYRGSSPVQWAIINGDKKLGVTIMRTVLKVDAGDMILREEIELEGWENSAEALVKLSSVGGRLAVEALNKLENGDAEFIKQDENTATHCRMLTKEDGRLDFNRSAEEVVNFVRGMNPWPGAFTVCEHGVLKVIRAAVTDGSGEAGEILAADKHGLKVACGQGAVEFVTVKPENAKEMDGAAFLRGRRLTVGRKLGE